MSHCEIAFVPLDFDEVVHRINLHNTAKFAENDYKKAKGRGSSNIK